MLNVWLASPKDTQRRPVPNAMARNTGLAHFYCLRWNGADSDEQLRGEGGEDRRDGRTRGATLELRSDGSSTRRGLFCREGGADHKKKTIYPFLYIWILWPCTRPRHETFSLCIYLSHGYPVQTLPCHPGATKLSGERVRVLLLLCFFSQQQQSSRAF